jgi:hypothetical protein
MPFGGPNSERALILAPRGRDAEIASALFQEAGWATLICADIGRLCEEFPKGAAFAVVAEEALTTNELAAFGKCLEAQPNWSDFPVVILTAHDETPGRNEIAIQLQNVLGNVSFFGATLPSDHADQCGPCRAPISTSAVPDTRIARAP